MPSKRYFSYVRVSTQRQGQTGTSLPEQTAAIERYAVRHRLLIDRRYEERETAAKQGRPVFLEMLKALRRGQADGVIIHKIDRSARNLKDWADLGTLIDGGVEVHFANESVDLSSRGGRLSADIQAVVAADYIRNLKEEVKKGFYGRLKQGLYPMPAPTGYVDRGQGQPKEPHPGHAPLVRQAFELYATGKWSTAALAAKLSELGLRNRLGNPLDKNGMGAVLRNPFYAGLVRIDRTGEFFTGRHQPLITKALFDRVRAAMDGRLIDKKQQHFFVFRRLVECARCARKVVPERQKGHVYYRCQTRGCPQKTVREETVERGLTAALAPLRLSDAENRYFEQWLAGQSRSVETSSRERAQTLNLRLSQCRERLSKLTDAYVDGVLERELYLDKKNALVIEGGTIRAELAQGSEAIRAALTATAKFLELSNRAYASYNLATGAEKREMVQILTSNLAAAEKNVVIKLKYPFEIIANRRVVKVGGPYRDVARTNYAYLSRLAQTLYEHFSTIDLQMRDT